MSALSDRPRREPPMAAIAEFHGIDPHRCYRCGELARTERAHVIDRVFGGLDAVQNLVPLCARCHHEQPPRLAGEERAAWLWLAHPHEFDYLVCCTHILVHEIGLDRADEATVHQGRIAAGLHYCDCDHARPVAADSEEPSPHRARDAG